MADQTFITKNDVQIQSTGKSSNLFKFSLV